MGNLLIPGDLTECVVVLIFRNRRGIPLWVSETVNVTQGSQEVKANLLQKSRIYSMNTKHDFLVLPEKLPGGLDKAIKKYIKENYQKS